VDLLRAAGSGGDLDAPARCRPQELAPEPHGVTSSCLRAHHFGSYTYSVIKNILCQGLDTCNRSLDANQRPTSSAALRSPIGELLHRTSASMTCPGAR